MTGTKPKAVVIGASAGAIDALNKLLPVFARECTLAMMIVVHIPQDRDSLLPEVLAANCRLKVVEAEDKQPIEPGTIYVAPSNYHLLVEKDNFLSLSSEEPVNFSRPSIDILFESAADAYGEDVVGIVLTGGNDDGAQGLKAILEAGGTAIVQDPDEAAVREMPRAALRACPSARSLSLAEIADFIAKAGAPA